jgi:glycerophosphoryl diester phosphodiesterase
MRSSRSNPDPLDPGRNGFVHRGLHRGPEIPENSLTAFAAALELGAGIECDLRLTADNQVVVFHDADLQRLFCNPTIIGQTSLAQLKALPLGPIPPLAELLALVAGRVPLLLEAKVDRDLWRFGPALVAALDGYAGRLGVMSFHPGLIRWLKTNAPHLRRGLVIRDSLSPLRRWVAMTLADPAFLAVDIAAIRRPWVARARGHIPVYTWTVRTRADRALALAHVDAPIWEADGRP